MKEVQWNDSMSVGVDLIDEQHKMWIQHLNDLKKAIELHEGPNKTLETLSFLIDYTHFHFSTEEKYMIANNYDGLEYQKKQHDEFKKTLANLENDLIEEGPTHELADSIDTLLVNWLIKHILEADVQFGAFLKDNGIVITEE